MDGILQGQVCLADGALLHLRQSACYAGIAGGREGVEGVRGGGGEVGGVAHQKLCPQRVT